MPRESGSGSASITAATSDRSGAPAVVTPGRAAPRVAVLGEALVDLFPTRTVIGGAPFNVARNLAAFGAAPLMVTRVGEDALGDRIAADFARFGLDTAGLQRDRSRPTGTVEVHMEGRQHRFEIVADTAWDAIDREAAVAAVRRARPAIVYFGTLAQRSAASRDAIRAALDAAEGASIKGSAAEGASTNGSAAEGASTSDHAIAGASTSDPAVAGASTRDRRATGAAVLRFLDLNLRDGPDNRALSAESLALADDVKVNDEELDRLIDWFVRPGEPVLAWGETLQRQAIDSLMARFRLRRLVITRGPAGWACRDVEAADGGWLEGAAPPVVLRDTVGAGDAFASVFLLGELRGWPLATTLARAAGFASGVCGIDGAVDADSPIYSQALAGWSA